MMMFVKLKEAGFTLIELIITLVILGFTSLLLIPFFQAIEHSSDPIIRERTVALGQALLDEIISKRWDQNTPVGGGPLCANESTGRGTSVYGAHLDCTTETVKVATSIASLGADAGESSRSVYNDIDDYNDMVAETDNFTDQAGVGFTYVGYSRSVSVDYVPSNSSSVDASTTASTQATDTKRIRVTVSNPLGEQFVFIALVCNF